MRYGFFRYSLPEIFCEEIFFEKSYILTLNSYIYAYPRIYRIYDV